MMELLLRHGAAVDTKSILVRLENPPNTRLHMAILQQSCGIFGDRCCHTSWSDNITTHVQSKSTRPTWATNFLGNARKRPFWETSLLSVKRTPLQFPLVVWPFATSSSHHMLSRRQIHYLKRPFQFLLRDSLRSKHAYKSWIRRGWQDCVRILDSWYYLLRLCYAAIITCWALVQASQLVLQNRKHINVILCALHALLDLLIFVGVRLSLLI